MELPDERYEGLHIPALLSVDEEEEFIALVNCDIFKQMVILRRIGSDSAVGTAWLSTIDVNGDEKRLVVKLQKDQKKAQQEFDIQYHLSSKYPDNFLIGYDSIDCDQVSFTDKEGLVTYKSGNFIFMEVAYGDIAQVLQYDHISDKLLIEYVLQVIDGVEIMAKQFIYHGDLHARQIFIVQRDGKNRAVIGDFGEHMQIESMTSHLSDISFFLNSLREVLAEVRRKRSDFNDKLNSAVRYVNSITMKHDLLPDDTDIPTLVEEDMEKIREFFQ